MGAGGTLLHMALKAIVPMTVSLSEHGKHRVLLVRLWKFIAAHGGLKMGEAGVQAHVLPVPLTLIISAHVCTSACHTFALTAQRGISAALSKSQPYA